MTTLAGKVEILHERLATAGVPHAFGGALALAYCTAEPRATADIDVNVFVSPARTLEVFEALPQDISKTEADVSTVHDRGQVRLHWGDAPIDLFFAYHDFHHQAAGRKRIVPFADIEIPVLDCADLVVFKAIFGRPRDWVDIEAIGAAGLELDVALERLGALLGTDNVAYRRLATIGSNATDESEPYRRAFGTPEDI